MLKASKELLREFVNNQHFTSMTEIMNSMKELFSDVLQQVMELVSKNIVEHWTAVCRNWDMVSDQLCIMFSDRASS